MEKIDTSNIKISNHALIRFKERWLKVDKNSTLKRPERTIRRFLVGAREIKKKPVPTVRAILKYWERAKYFEKSGWIFVTNEEMTTLLTVIRLSDSPGMWEIDGGKKKRGGKK